MNVNKLVVIALVALMSVPAAAYASQYTDSKANQRLVAGHTSYAVLSKTTYTCLNQTCPNAGQKEEGTAVAVLTQENVCNYNTNDPSKLNGVLWFNDQFLVGDDSATGGNNTYSCTLRYPCAGTVYATNAGLPNPTAAIGTFPLDIIQYQESYQIMDPNDHVWNIDLWRVPLGSLNLSPTSLNPAQPIWTINILGAFSALDGQADPGTGTCAPFSNTAPAAATPNVGSGNASLLPAYPTITYNALLFMRFKDLVTSGSVQYGYNPTVGADAYESTSDGNSHPWNNGPTAATAADTHTHATARVDLYYTYTGRPIPSQNAALCPTGTTAQGGRCFWIIDGVGSAAPFDTHP